MDAGWFGEHSPGFCSRPWVPLSFAVFIWGGGSREGGALFFQRDPEGAQDNGGHEETIRHLLLCLFLFSGPTMHRQLSLNTTPESAWEGSCGDRVGQDGFMGWTATLAACTLQLPPRVPASEQRSILELEDGQSREAPSATPLRGAPDSGHTALFQKHSCAFPPPTPQPPCSI